MTIRKPIKPLTEAERVSLAWDRGRDFDNLPRELTDEERAAAKPVTAEEIRAMPEPIAVAAPVPADAPVARKAVIPERFAKWTGILGAALSFAVLLPFSPWSTIAALVGAALVLLSGGALPQFKFLAGKPVLTGTALFIASAVIEQGGAFVYSLPPGLPFNAGFLALTALCFLTGKAAPQPMVAVKT